MREQIAALPPDQRAEVSPAFLERLHSMTGSAPWLLGFWIQLSSSGENIGGCGFKGPPDDEGVVEIAYGISPRHQRMGFATEATQALVSFAFQHPDVRIVRAHTREADTASVGVLEKCGFHSIGRVIDPEDGLVWRWERQRAQ